MIWNRTPIKVFPFCLVWCYCDNRWSTVHCFPWSLVPVRCLLWWSIIGNANERNSRLALLLNEADLNQTHGCCEIISEPQTWRVGHWEDFKCLLKTRQTHRSHVTGCYQRHDLIQKPSTHQVPLLFPVQPADHFAISWWFQDGIVTDSNGHNSAGVFESEAAVTFLAWWGSCVGNINNTIVRPSASQNH